MDAGPAEMVVPSESGGQGEVESTRQRGAMSRAAVHSARCLTSCQWMFTVACTAIAQKKRWGVDAMRELLAQDLAFAGECPEQGVSGIDFGRLHIATARAAVLVNNTTGLSEKAVPCVLWLRIGDIEKHHSLEQAFHTEPEEPVRKADLDWSTSWIADTEHLVCDAVIGMRTRAILEGDADSNFRRRIARLNRAMPKIGSRRELLSALFKCTKLDDVMLGSRLTDAIREAPQWTSLYDSYQTQRTRLLKWVTETNEDERKTVANKLRENINLEASLLEYLDLHELRIHDTPDLHRTKAYATFMTTHDEKAAGDEWHPASGSLGDDEGSAEVGSGMELTPEDASGQEASVESQHGERNQVFTPPEHQGPRRVSNERATPDISDDSELRPKLILPTATFEVSEIEDNESSFHTQEVDKRQPEREVKKRKVEENTSSEQEKSEETSRNISHDTDNGENNIEDNNENNVSFSDLMEDGFTQELGVPQSQLPT